MATCPVTLTQGSLTIDIAAQKIDEDITKNWRINSIPTIFDDRFTTTTSANEAIGSTAINVTDGSGFSDYDRIIISGDDLAGDYHTEVVTITSIAGNVLTISQGIVFGYASGANVMRQGRVISLDFNQTVQSITVTGKVVATATKEARDLKSILWRMATGGGAITVEYDGTAQANMGITKMTITRVAEDTEKPQMYDVILNMTNSSVEQGAL